MPSKVLILNPSLSSPFTVTVQFALHIGYDVQEYETSQTKLVLEIGHGIFLKYLEQNFN